MIEPQITTYDEAKRLGKRLYCTGKPCPKGHLCDRRVASRGCIECEALDRKARYAIKRTDPAYMADARKRAKEWATKNPEQYRANQAKWRKDSGPQWLAENMKKVRGQQAASKKRAAQTDPDFHKRVHRRARARNPEEYSRKTTERARQWAKKNPEKYRALMRAACANRRALMKDAGKISASDVQAVLARGTCEHCGRLHKRMEVDHIVALSRGGSNHLSNLQLLCRPCNARKWAHDYVTWARSNQPKTE